MPVSISDHIGVTPKRFDQTGAFDAILDIDSRLFIDPHLLKNARVPEFTGSYDKVKKRFSDVLKLLKASNKEGDSFWRAAVARFSFPELRGLCIGYSARGTAGSGMGKVLRTRILRTAKEIVNAGILDPEIFELVGLFEENVGADRIGDMVGRIIVDDLQKYTERIFTELTVKTVRVPNSTYKSIINPFNKNPVILVPNQILRDLPVALDWSEIDLVCEFNDALRRKVNALIGDTWKRATSQKKNVLRSVILSQPDVLRDLVHLYKDKAAASYDFKTDPAGQVIWLRASRDYVANFPLKFALPPTPSATDVLKVVRGICNKFKDLVENNGLSKLLYDDKSRKPKKEEAAQLVFFGIADAYCEANNLDLSPEADGGRGPVDFKISKGYKGRVLVEAKLTTNKNLVHGFTTQLVEYQKAEKTTTSIFLVIDVTGGHEKQVAKLKALISKSAAGKLRVPEVIFVDGLPKKSASKYVPSPKATGP